VTISRPKSVDEPVYVTQATKQQNAAADLTNNPDVVGAVNIPVILIYDQTTLLLCFLHCARVRHRCLRRNSDHSADASYASVGQTDDQRY